MKLAKPYILIVDDEPDIRQLVFEILEDEGYEVAMAENAQVARQLKKTKQPDLILLDIWMPDTDGISLLKEWYRNDKSLCPVIMMSGHGNVETAVEATRLGAFDFLEKPISLAKLLQVVERGLESQQKPKEYSHIQLPADSIEPVGKSASIGRLKDQLKRLAQHDTPVLFTGEAGSGKELFARYLHNNSSHRHGAFVDVAVGSLSLENSAVEFFGREQGSKIYPGLLEQAHGGSLFLSDINNLDLAVQVRLLSALESSSFLRVGGNTAVSVDVRIIASSRQSLEQAVKVGNFRQDLYHWLNVVTLDVLPLREHSEDVPALLTFYVDYFVANQKFPLRKFSIATQNFLRNYDWSGNVRELKNLVQHLLILGAGDDIELSEIKEVLGAETEENLSSIPEFFNLPLKEAREHFEKAYLEYHFEKTKGSVAKLSRVVGMERTHLYRKLHTLNIKL